MGVFEAVLVFSISWWLVFLPILSAGTRSQYEAGEVSPGTDPAAPVKLKMLSKVLWASVGAAVITGLLWAVLKLGLISFVATPPQ